MKSTSSSTFFASLGMTLCILTILVLSSNLRAQTALPAVPDTVFPLGGLSFGDGLNLPPGMTWSQELLNFGLNTYCGGAPQLTTPGVTSYMGQADGGWLGWFLPNGSVGFNPLFSEADLDLASNESGAAAWDLQANWALANGVINSNGEYDIGPLLGLVDGNNDYLLGFNGSSAWNQTSAYTPGQLVTFTSSDPNCTNTLWVCTKEAMGTAQEPTCANSTFWQPGSTFNFGSYLGSDPTDFVDFIYRIDPNLYTGTSEIYELDCTIHWINPATNDPSTTVLTPLAINADGTNSSGFTPPSTENPNILNFPNTKFNPPPPLPQHTSHSYSIARFTVTNPGGLTVTSIDLNLKGIAANGIFVRGARVRCAMADDMFHGQFDNAQVATDGNDIDQIYQNSTGGAAGFPLTHGLNTLFQTIRQGFTSSDWILTKVLTGGGNEDWPQAYRVYTYLNEFLRNYSAHNGGQKNFNSIQAGLPTYWRSIYEDQSNDVPPPPLQEEGIEPGYQPEGFAPPETSTPYFAIGRPDHDFKPRLTYWDGVPNADWVTQTPTTAVEPWFTSNAPQTSWTSGPTSATNFFQTWGSTWSGLLFAGDAIPANVKNHMTSGVRDFQEEGLTITGWNGSSYGATSTAIPLTSDSNNYATYTSRFQNATSGSFGSVYYNAATTCYPQGMPSLWTSFYGYPAAFADVNAPLSTNILDVGKMQTTIYQDLQSNAAPSSLNFTYSQLSGNQLSAATNPATANQYTPPNFADYFRYWTQPPTQWELREQTWDALAWGAKGIIYNPIGSDGSQNIGACGLHFDTSSNSGFPDIDPDPTYVAFPFFKFAPAGGVIPPMTHQVYQNHPSYSGTQCFPDHWVHSGIAIAWNTGIKYLFGSLVSTNSGSSYWVCTTPNTSTASNEPPSSDWESISKPTSSYKIWVPCVSDFTIYAGEGQTTSILINVGDNISSNLIDTYIHGVQNYNSTNSAESWSAPSSALTANQTTNLLSYYTAVPQASPNSGTTPPSWLPEVGGNDAQNPDGTPYPNGIGPSDWAAFDRNLDANYPYRTGGFTGYNSWWSAPIYYPGPSVYLNISQVPCYYGVKDRSDGVKRSTADIVPIAAELKKLRWRTTFTYADVVPTGTIPSGNNQIWATNTGYPESPLEISIDPGSGLPRSHQLQTYFYSASPLPGHSHYETLSPESFDEQSSLLYDFGIFTDPKDPGAYYVIVTNKRTWPIIFNSTHTGIIENDPSDGEQYLGAIDARQIDLQLKPSWIDSLGNSVNWPNSGIDYYTIENLRPSTATFGHADTTAQTNPPSGTTPTYSLTLEPGEGTLLRVAPATAINLGRTNYMGMGYNNGHRVAEVHTSQVPLQSSGGCPTIQPFRGVCWESNGSIQFQLCPQSTSPENTEYANPPILPATAAITVYNPPSPCSSCLCPSTSSGPWPAHSQDGHNPSIASKSSYVGILGHNDTIGIVFSIDDYPARACTRSVMFAYSTDNGTTWNNPSNNPAPFVGPSTNIASDIPYNITGVPDVTGVGTDGQYSDLLVPTISSAHDGFVGVYTESFGLLGPTVGTPFWIHVSTLGGVHWEVTALPNLAQLPTPQTAGNVRFATVATNDDVSNQHLNSNNLFSEIFHFAWESDFLDGSSGIYYQAIEHTWPGDGFSTPGPVTPVSDGYPILNPVVVGPGTGSIMPSPPCPHHHPMIAVINGAMPAITWEVTDEEGIITNTSNPFTGWEYVTGATKPIEREAGSFSNLTPSWGSFFTVQALETGNLPQPVLRYEKNVCSGITSPNFRELVFQDTFGHEAFVYRKNKTAISALSWTANRLEDYAQTPSVSLPYEPDPSPDLGSISYREIYPDQNNLYAAMVVANPPAEEPVSKNLVKYLSVVYQPHVACGLAAISIGIGPGWKWLPSGPPADGSAPPGNPTGTPSGSPVAPWNFQPVGIFTPVLSGGSTVLVQSSWPLTEDSIRTSNFPTTTLDSITISRVLVVDTSQLAALLPDATHYISYKLVVKDSASHTITQVLDSATIKGGVLSGGSSYPGVNPNDTSMIGMGYNIHAIILPTLSGSAYITAIITKDNSTQAELIQDEEYADSVAFQVPVVDSSSDSSGGGGGGPAPKIATGQSSANTSPLVVTVHPNPANNSVKVCVEDIPGGVPVVVDVVNEIGLSVATLYNATPEAELGLCLQLDCSQLPSGIYYADLQTQGMHNAVKFTVEH